VGLALSRQNFFPKKSTTLYSVIALVTALFPLIQIIAIRLFRDFIFIHGESPGLYPIFFFILTFSAPYAFLIGFILPYSLSIIKTMDTEFTVGELYITDNIGDITGGVLFSFVLVYFFSPFKIIAFTSFLLILVSLVLFISLKRYLLFLWHCYPLRSFLRFAF